MIGRGPITMTVEQRADDAAIQHAGKRFVLRLRLPFGNDFAVFGKAADPQTFAIRRAATPTRIFGSVLFLKRWFSHGGSSSPSLDARNYAPKPRLITSPDVAADPPS